MIKKVLAFILPACIAFSVQNIPVQAKATKSEIKTDKQVVVYYFYGKPRCVTCKKIEDYTKEAVQELKSEKVSFKPVDYDKPENKHFIKDYKLFTKSVIVSERKNGKEISSKNLDKIWTLTKDEAKFKNYIKKEVKSSLEN